MKPFLFILGIIAFLIIAFVFLNGKPLPAPEGLDDATNIDRCARFRVVDTEDTDIYSLGYKGRIEQLLHGCF
ncbi:MAG TPA: hypothetical protein VJH21_01490 [Candidatus Paceibacterota bacterium]